MVALKGLLRQFGVVKVLFKVSKIDAVSKFYFTISYNVYYIHSVMIFRILRV